MKYLISTLLLFLVITVYAQEYQEKKDVILKDKVPYGKISGKVGMTTAKQNVAILSLNNDSLIMIKGFSFPSNHPKLKYLGSFEFRFIASGRKIIVQTPNSLFLVSKNQLLDYHFKPFKGDLIVNNAIDPTAEEEYTKLFDITPLIESAKAFQENEKVAVKNLTPLNVLAGKPFLFKSTGKTSDTKSTTETFSVSQEGRSYDVTVKKIISPTINFGTTYEYFVNRPVQEPLILGSEQHNQALIAYVSVTGFQTVFVTVEGKERSIKLTNLVSSEGEIIQWLVNEKLL